MAAMAAGAASGISHADLAGVFELGHCLRRATEFGVRHVLHGHEPTLIPYEHDAGCLQEKSKHGVAEMLAALLPDGASWPEAPPAVAQPERHQPLGVPLRGRVPEGEPRGCGGDV